MRMLLGWLVFGLVLVCQVVCGSVIDPNSSLSNDFRPSHLHMDWTVDFDAKRVYGSVTFKMISVDPVGCNTLTLDAAHLDITSVFADNKVVPFVVNADNLKVTLPEAKQTVTIM